MTIKCFILLATVLMATSAGAATLPHNHEGPIEVQVCRRVAQLVRLSPNPSPNGMLAVQLEGKEAVHFYIFDVEGTIMFHALLQPGEKRQVAHLKTGAYSYDVFRKDESVEQGKIIVH